MYCRWLAHTLHMAKLKYLRDRHGMLKLPGGFGQQVVSLQDYRKTQLSSNVTSNPLHSTQENYQTPGTAGLSACFQGIVESCSQ